MTDNRSHGHAYTEAMRRGGCVVVVDGVGDDRVDEAARVLEQNGAFDIDERASKWRAEGWQAPEMIAPTTSAQSRPQMQAETRPRTRQASGQMQAQAAGTGMQSGANGKNASERGHFSARRAGR